jgi:hypothetical protein
MSSRVRLILLFTGLAILCCSLLLVGYALFPLHGALLQDTLPSTLFAPP